MGSISSKFLNAHSFYGVQSAKIIGECGMRRWIGIGTKSSVYNVRTSVLCIVFAQMVQTV